NELDELNRGVIAEFRANGGKVGGQFASNDILLLHSVGSRSRTERVNPLGDVRDGDDMLVVGSLGGAPDHPAWYWNLKAHPHTEEEVGTETAGAVVTEAMPGRLEYEKLPTCRQPIIRLALA